MTTFGWTVFFASFLVLVGAGVGIYFLVSREVPTEPAYESRAEEVPTVEEVLPMATTTDTVPEDTASTTP